ncbi:XisH family protein [Phaeodactylibacter sp.]|jgi:hypothetical protein|uniref:XisH family protein n=1 Tax=Phaeodactylibacter sp. TaxID=1940289 RepID=UPI0025F69E80|nr:XisH family protein [Phaeodactylibacter sp.]MCI4648122.1 XisH family protein [Phaeodactylibacter sp.]MCI5090590.1 XisH family protein [Phaeodactylibacter sp.]
MPAKDFYHDHVKFALEAEGWKITHDPFFIRVGRRKSFIDLGAEKAVIGAEKEGVKIAVEIKSFLGASDLDEFEDALGQFIIYFNALEEKDPDRHLYMAMPGDFYERFFEDGFFRKLAERYSLKMIIFDEKTKVIHKWIK